METTIAALALFASALPSMHANAVVGTFSATLDPVSISVTNGADQVRFVDLSITGLDFTPILLDELGALSATLTISPTPGGPATIPWIIDQATITPGAYFDAFPGTPYLSAGPSGTTVAVSFQPNMDPGTGASIAWPTFGTLARIGVKAPAGAEVGTWTLSAVVTLEGVDPDGFDAVADSLPAGTSLTITAVPEPETYALFLAGLGIVAVAGLRRRA